MQNLLTAEQLRELIASTLEVDPALVTGDADLLADLGADSLALASLLAVLEKSLQLRLPPDHFADVETVDDLHAVIRETIESARLRESAT